MSLIQPQCYCNQFSLASAAACNPVQSKSSETHSSSPTTKLPQSSCCRQAAAAGHRWLPLALRPLTSSPQTSVRLDNQQPQPRGTPRAQVFCTIVGWLHVKTRIVCRDMSGQQHYNRSSAAGPLKSPRPIWCLEYVICSVCRRHHAHTLSFSAHFWTAELLTWAAGRDRPPSNGTSAAVSRVTAKLAMPCTLSAKATAQMFCKAAGHCHWQRTAFQAQTEYHHETHVCAWSRCSSLRETTSVIAPLPATLRRQHFQNFASYGCLLCCNDKDSHLDEHTLVCCLHANNWATQS